MYKLRDARKNYAEIECLAGIAERVLKEAPTYTHVSFNKKRTMSFIVDAMTRKDMFLKVIAREEDDVAVGGIICFVEQIVTSDDLQAYDLTIMLDEEHRGRCLPQIIELVSDYKVWARKQGAKIIKLGVSSGINIDRAATFFERLGFSRIGSMHAYVMEA